jgi:hypothetical protein
LGSVIFAPLLNPDDQPMEATMRKTRDIADQPSFRAEL